MKGVVYLQLPTLCGLFTQGLLKWQKEQALDRFISCREGYMLETPYRQVVLSCPRPCTPPQGHGWLLSSSCNPILWGWWLFLPATRWEMPAGSLPEGAIFANKADPTFLFCCCKLKTRFSSKGLQLFCISLHVSWFTEWETFGNVYMCVCVGTAKHLYIPSPNTLLYLYLCVPPSIHPSVRPSCHWPRIACALHIASGKGLKAKKGGGNEMDEVVGNRRWQLGNWVYDTIYPVFCVRNRCQI